MYRPTQEASDTAFDRWVSLELHRLKLLEESGFTWKESIEMLKIQKLSYLAEVIRSIR